MDNSLLREHHSFILDLPVQGQDVLINERALWEDRQEAGLDPHCNGQQWVAAYAPTPSRQMGRAPSNLLKVHSKGSVNVTEQVSHWRSHWPHLPPAGQPPAEKASLFQGLAFGDMSTEYRPPPLVSLSVVTRTKAPVGGNLDHISARRPQDPTL